MTESTAAATPTATTSQPIPVDVFRTALLSTLDETFENVNGYFLDKGTSMFETLAAIDAATASKVFSSRASNIAAQVNHTRFYLDVLLRGIQNGFDEKADWDGSWKVGEVNDQEWQELIDRLRASYAQVRAFAESNTTWNADSIGGAFALVAHCAYHLGEIRQALAALQVPE